MNLTAPRTFGALLQLLPTTEGGRKTPAKIDGTRYRPLFRLDGYDQKSSCLVGSNNQDSLMQPGEERIVQITILHPEYFGAGLLVGAKFDIFEGPKTVGKGKLLEPRNNS